MGNILVEFFVKNQNETEELIHLYKCDRVPFTYNTWNVNNFYRIDHVDDSTIMMSCLTNYHLVSGNLRWTCLSNGSWEGVEPVCEVDYLKDKWTLSAIIVTISFVLPLLWLGTDFFMFVKKRNLARRKLFIPLTDLRKREHILGEHHIARKLSAAHMISQTNMDRYGDKEDFFNFREASIERTGTGGFNSPKDEETRLFVFKPRKYKSSNQINQFAHLGHPYWNPSDEALQI